MHFKHGKDEAYEPQLQLRLFFKYIFIERPIRMEILRKKCIFDFFRFFLCSINFFLSKILHCLP